MDVSKVLVMVIIDARMGVIKMITVSQARSVVV